MDELKSWLWPDISNRRQIHFAIMEGYWACIVVAVIFLATFLIDILRSFDPEKLMGAAMPTAFFVLAYKIEHRSPAAAVTAFSLYLLNLLVTFIAYGPRGFFFSIFISVALYNAIRGTFAYRKLPTPPPGTPSLDESFAAFRKVPIPRDPPKDLSS